MEIVSASDRALLVRLAGHEQVVAFARALELFKPPSVTSYSPAYESVLVRYDPCATDPAALSEALLALKGATEESTSRELVLPMTFDGPDLDDLARKRGLAPADVVTIFCSTQYRVYFLGFVPGFAYMGDVDERIATPRRSSPRKAVPAGSVGIADRQTGIYPLQTPGGWNLIGTCATRLFVPEQHPPCLLRPGDRVRFEPA